MRLISLTHERALRYPPCHKTFSPASIQVENPENCTIVSFAYSKSARRISALDRFLEPLKGDVVLAHFDSSPLAAQLLWDITHRLPVGNKIYLTVSENTAGLLTRSYYRDAFNEISSGDSTTRCFIKQLPLVAEADRGLHSWSFCIPTGNGDPAALNACVARIISLDLPEFEIILCGRPHPDFRFERQVRIVGEDITAPPLHITRKKNVLAQAARYPNLCILHDRVLLPTNFREAIEKFGDDYPFTAFQSLWFADTWLAVPRRYSDADTMLSLPDINFSKGRISRQDVLTFDATGFTGRHPKRASFGCDYLTGSLYLCKKSVWQHVPQNESLYWQEYEDIEHGIYAAHAGIPSSINPYAFTLTLSYRSIFNFFGMCRGMQENGKISLQRAPQEFWGFPRRPHLTLKESDARTRMAAFARKYVGNDRIVREASSLRGLKRYCLVARLLWEAKGGDDLVTDWFRDVLGEAASPLDLQYFNAVLKSPASPEKKKLILLRHPSLLRQIFNNPFSSAFIPENETYPSAGKLCQAFGRILSALWLKYGSSHLSIRLSFFRLWQLLEDPGQHLYPEKSGGNHNEI